MIKAVFLDIDGTLLSNTTGQIPKSAGEAIDSMRMNGVKVFTATGRHMSEIRDLPVDDIRFDGYITLNGQLCLDSRKELLYGEAIGERDVELMLAMFEEKKVPVMLVEKDRMYINYIDELVERHRQRSIHQFLKSALIPESRSISLFCIQRKEWQRKSWRDLMAAR